MYLDYFGLERNPFELTPDSSFLYESQQHAQAIANIRFALAARDSFAIITGEIGVGKTTVLNKVLADIPRDASVARITHTTLTPVELFQALLGEFGRRSYSKRKVKLVNHLQDFLLEQSTSGRQVIIMIDEAQNLSKDVLEELRLISCIETETRKIVQVVLIGQPELNELVNSRELEQLRQRARLRQHISALGENETLEYMAHRVAVAGGSYSSLFEEDVAPLVYLATGGIPRLINTLCDTALTGCFVEEARRVSRAMVEQVIAELGWDKTAPGAPDVDKKQVAADVHPAALLLSYRGDELKGRVPVTAVPMTIGRGSSNDLQVDDRFLSRRHALIGFDNGEFYIEDLKSLNGTRLNEAFVSRETLRSGDHIVIGNHSFHFYLAGAAPDRAGDASLDESEPELHAGIAADEDGAERDATEQGESVRAKG